MSYGSGIYADVIYAGTWKAGPNEMMYGPMEPGIAEVPIAAGNTNLIKLEVVITDTENKPLTFHGAALDSDIMLSFQIFPRAKLV